MVPISETSFSSLLLNEAQMSLWSMKYTIYAIIEKVGSEVHTMDCSF